MSILQKTYLASVGIYNLSRKKAEEIIDSLIKAGEINSSERQQAILELLEKTEKSAGRMASKLKKETGQLQKDIDRKVSKFKLATKKDLEKLSKKIDQLAKALDKKK
ncbi:MAG: phasin family protein [Candidatus Zixiibacteriota bacterium]